MRFALVIMVLLGFFSVNNAVYAQSTCTQCRDQLKECQKNYAGKTCQIEYTICMKGCKK
jgi:cytochrome c biogenesis protein ResB